MKQLMIVAGEASGDLHGAHLVQEIKRLQPNIVFSGIGGEKMRASGVELYENITSLAVVGFIEVLKHYKEIKRVFHLVLDQARRRRPAAVILIDYPGFNLRLAKELKKLNIKVIYYISPQVWAWKENRVTLIKEVTDRMLILFEFEKEFYRRHGIDAIFVGHPLLDTVQIRKDPKSLLASLGLIQDRFTIGLLPGSRRKEIENMLPIMLTSAEILYRQNPNLQFIVLKAPTINRDLIERHLDKCSLPVKVLDDQTYDGINACRACLVTSGTATLETAILEKPMVVIYKTSLFTWLLAKIFIKIPNIGLVNVVAGKKIVPECVQFDATPEKIAQEMRNLIESEPKLAAIRKELTRVKSLLGTPGASRRAAEEVLKSIE